MTEVPQTELAAANTDRELWRETEGDYYAPSIFVTKQGGIGIDVGGHVIVKPLREWHALASRPSPLVDTGEALREALVEAREALQHILRGALSLPRFAEDQAATAIAKIDAALAAHPKPEEADNAS